MPLAPSLCPGELQSAAGHNHSGRKTDELQLTSRDLNIYVAASAPNLREALLLWRLLDWSLLDMRLLPAIVWQKRLNQQRAADGDGNNLLQTELHVRMLDGSVQVGKKRPGCAPGLSSLRARIQLCAPAIMCLEYERQVVVKQEYSRPGYDGAGHDKPDADRGAVEILRVAAAPTLSVLVGWTPRVCPAPTEKFLKVTARSIGKERMLLNNSQLFRALREWQSPVRVTRKNCLNAIDETICFFLNSNGPLECVSEKWLIHVEQVHATNNLTCKLLHFLGNFTKSFHIHQFRPRTRRRVMHRDW